MHYLDYADLALAKKKDNLAILTQGLSNSDPVIRYWSVIGLLRLEEKASSAIEELKKVLNDKYEIPPFAAWAIHKAGEDKRFADIKVNPPRLLMTWTLQGLWVCICSASALVALTSSMMLDISTIFIAGLALFTIGFLLEVIADNQKTKFNSLPENKDKFINVGLWSRSRHPNYFGEFLVWAGISIMSIEYMSGLSYAALISPVFSYLLINYVSGVRMLENKARKKWGHLDSYKEYLAKTPKFMPKLF